MQLGTKQFLIKTVSSLSGFSGASVGGWYTWLEANPTGDEWFTNRNYEFKPKLLGGEIGDFPDLKLGEIKNEIKTHLCFKSFFGNNLETTFTLNGSSTDISDPSNSENESPSKVEGCMLWKNLKILLQMTINEHLNLKL